MSSTNPSPSDTPSTEASADSPEVQAPLQVLDYGFPAPQGDLDIEEALRRKPLRWTFQGQVEANKLRPVAVVPDDSRKRDLERAKQDLLEMQGVLSNNAKTHDK